MKILKWFKRNPNREKEEAEQDLEHIAQEQLAQIEKENPYDFSFRQVLDRMVRTEWIEERKGLERKYLHWASGDVTPTRTTRRTFTYYHC